MAGSSVRVKPRGQRGELEFSRAQVHQVNLPATVLSLAGVDSPYREPAFAEIPEGENRPRKFMRQFGKARSNSEIDYEQYVVSAVERLHELPKEPRRLEQAGFSQAIASRASPWIAGTESLQCPSVQPRRFDTFAFRR